MLGARICPGMSKLVFATVLTLATSHDCSCASFQVLTLQSCLISKMEGLEGLASLKRLTLYDNQILSLVVPPALSGLTYVDVSYNLIKSTAALATCPLLEEVNGAPRAVLLCPPCPCSRIRWTLAAPGHVRTTRLSKVQHCTVELYCSALYNMGGNVTCKMYEERVQAAASSSTDVEKR